MLRKRNLLTLILAAMLSLSTIGVAFADESGGDRLDSGLGTATSVELDAAH